MKKIIINGANGYVASNFINSLLNTNYQVIALVRGSKKLSANERMFKVLSEINDAEYVRTCQLKVYAYSLTEENFSMAEEDLQDIFSGEFDYYHFAASLKYDRKSKNEIFGTNIDGIKNSLDVYARYANSKSRLFFISTAYSCGRMSGLFEEKFYDNDNISAFRNYYEQSKRYAENVVKNYIEEHQINAHIIRLSQVVGDSKTGITKTDYGIFDFAKRMFSLAHRYPNQTVRLKVDPEATQNLIPIDIVVHNLMRTVATEKVPTIMNFTAKKSVKNQHIIRAVTQLMPIKIVPVENLKKDDMSPLERLVSVGMSFTGNYININLHFDTKNTDSLPRINGYQNLNNEHQGISEEQSTYKMLEYFIGTLPVPKGSKTISKDGATV
ncbi:Nucleoside-diphosphate-sugar epimerase [Saccharicrinis carchari]|uniref:Nucleoside-diphosphate-sugar epimerase n=1 Tax=Saccharicrinis carchari TaxID=1168039 RepID=A0A521B3P6_SACCC|nr:SDR family oxidoreductase [Saccharicrinis carchari]SMO41641.1 Nucleoside-diphosphate-sugar epimerase [Saccharicrinis carchari]